MIEPATAAQEGHGECHYFHGKAQKEVRQLLSPISSVVMAFGLCQVSPDDTL